MEPRSCFSAPRARPRPGLSGELRRQARGKEKQCKCAPQQIIFNALFLVAFNPSGLSGRLQPHSPGKGNDRHYYPARNTGAVRGGGGGGAALPAPKFGNPTSNGKLRTRRKIRPCSKGLQDPLLRPQPASQTIPKYMSTGPGPGVWESPQSPSVSKSKLYNIPHCQVLPSL